MADGRTAEIDDRVVEAPQGPVMADADDRRVPLRFAQQAIVMVDVHRIGMERADQLQPRLDALGDELPHRVDQDVVALVVTAGLAIPAFLCSHWLFATGRKLKS